MIPKTIHYCWFGGNPIPDLAKKCIKSWEKYCPDYQIIEWNESNYDISDTPLYVQQAYDAKKWAFVSDYVRLAVVYENGGIYLDTDVELIKRPTELLKYSAFFGFEDDVHVNTGLGFGAEKHAPILADMMEDYRNLSFTLPDGSFDQTPCPIRNTKALERIGLVCDNSRQLLPGEIAVFPKDYFCPLDYYTGVLKKTKNTVSIHRFAASWYSEKEREAYIRKTAERQKEIRQERFRNGPKRFMRKLIGEERYNKAKEAFLLMWKGKKR